MVSEKMVAWGSQGCVIRDLAAYGEQRAAVVGAENVFNFTIGNPSVPAPSCVRQTIEHLLQTVPAEQLHAYTAAPGLASVRAKMAAYLEKTFGVGYRAEDVYMTSGASSALAMLAYALLSPGDEVLTLSPYFSEYKLYAEAAGGTLTAVPSSPEDFQIDLDAFSAAISEKTAVVLLNSPNNPSGVILSRRSITKLAELMEKKSVEYGHRIYIVADEPYRELAYDGEEVPFIPAIYKDTIYCYSFSKTLSLPGERIGFLAIHPELTDYARVRAAIYGAGRALGYINASTMFQLVAAQCVGQTADISVYKQNRDLIHTALLDMGYTCVKPSGAFYLSSKRRSRTRPRSAKGDGARPAGRAGRRIRLPGLRPPGLLRPQNHARTQPPPLPPARRPIRPQKISGWLRSLPTSEHLQRCLFQLSSRGRFPYQGKCRRDKRSGDAVSEADWEVS